MPLLNLQGLRDIHRLKEMPPIRVVRQVWRGDQNRYASVDGKTAITFSSPHGYSEGDALVVSGAGPTE